MAKHEVQLTNDSKDIYAGDVDVRNTGAYGKYDNCIVYVMNYKKEYFTAAPWNDQSFKSETFNSLKDLIESWGNEYEFYTIPDNRRIRTTKSLTVEDLKDTDYVGFVHENGSKGYSLYCYEYLLLCDNKFKAESTTMFKDIAAILDAWDIKTVIQFDTPSELHQWLAED